MIKNKLKSISDEDAIKVAELLIKTSHSKLFDIRFDKIFRQNYFQEHGIDAEESVNIFFNCTLKHEVYKKVGWKINKIWIQLIEKDSYHDYPHFQGHYMEEEDKVWKHYCLSNYIEAIEFLQNKGLV